MCSQLQMINNFPPKGIGLPDRKTRACPRTRFHSRPITEQQAVMPTAYSVRLLFGDWARITVLANQRNCLIVRSKPIRMRKTPSSQVIVKIIYGA
jgi:hypothetical protein